MSRFNLGFYLHMNITQQSTCIHRAHKKW